MGNGNSEQILIQLGIRDYFDEDKETQKAIWKDKKSGKRLYILGSNPAANQVAFDFDFFLMKSARDARYYFCDKTRYMKWVAEKVKQKKNLKNLSKDENPVIQFETKNSNPFQKSDEYEAAIMKAVNIIGSNNILETGDNVNKYGIFVTCEIEEMTKHIKGVFGLGTQEEQLKALIEQGERAIILHGAPGTGKTYTARKKLAGLSMECKVQQDDGKENQKGEQGDKLKIEIVELNGNFVQFHPSYDYTDFVEGYRPAIVKEKEQVSTFVRMDGIFKAFCRKVAVEKDEKKLYPFVIDEINRADLAKVFGELMFCVENGYRGEENRVKTHYDYLPTYEVKDKKSGLATLIEDDVFQDGFYIPENVIIIGTMNDIDRSVESIDFAMRRRFRFINVDATTEMRTGLEGMLLKNQNENENAQNEEDKTDKRIVNQLVESVNKLNEVIKKHFSEAYQIGHGYFKNFGKYYNTAKTNKEAESDPALVEAKRNIWNYSLKPLLEEYMRGRRTETDLEELENTFIAGVSPDE